MNYTLHQLQIFHKIVECESITKAAQELYLSQPAVSIQLKKFQEQFSIPLTEVVGRKLYITDFGREIGIAAERILNEVEAITYKTMAYQGQLSGKLRFSLVSTAKYVLPYFLSDFVSKERGVDLIIDVTNKATVIKSLEENRVDFALVSVIPDKLKIQKVQLMQNKLFLVASSKLKVSKKSKWKMFEDVPLIYREEGSATRAAMEDFIEQNALPTYRKMEMMSNEALKQAVIAGLGCSIMPLIGIRDSLKNGELQIIPTKGLPIITHWNIIWLTSKRLSPVALAFLDFIEKEKDRIIHETFDWFERY